MGTLENVRKGVTSELWFQAKAYEAGYNVSKPYGEHVPYDFIVEHNGHMSRVQVKSVSTESTTPNVYCIVTHHGLDGRLNYTDREADFVAAHIVPLDIWYIIPIANIAGRKSIRLHPDPLFPMLNPNAKTEEYEHFKEAWSIMK